MWKLIGIHLVGVRSWCPKQNWCVHLPFICELDTIVHSVDVSACHPPCPLELHIHHLHTSSKCIVYWGSCQGSALSILYHNVRHHCGHWGTHSCSMNLLVALPIVREVGRRKADCRSKMIMSAAMLTSSRTLSSSSIQSCLGHFNSQIRTNIGEEWSLQLPNA